MSVLSFEQPQCCRGIVGCSTLIHACRRRTATVPNGTSVGTEGQIVEICRDLAEQVKRMRQLHEQADELRVVIREWASPSRTS